MQWCKHNVCTCVNGNISIWCRGSSKPHAFIEKVYRGDLTIIVPVSYRVILTVYIISCPLPHVFEFKNLWPILIKTVIFSIKLLLLNDS